MGSKILMLWPDIEEDWPSQIPNLQGEVTVATLYKKAGKVSRLLRLIFSKLNISTGPFLNGWKYDVKNYDKVIIHANIINITVSKYLRNYGYNGRIIYWYWNPIINCVNPNRIDKNECEIWSFDPNDCEKYSLKFNTTYYLPEFCFEGKEIKQDVFFIGQDKGRIAYLLGLKDVFERCGLSTKFWVVKDRTSNYAYDYQKKISYKESLVYLLDSRAILDIVQDGQSGQTLRAMEALFFRKKLITNNLAIRNCDFYRNKNVFLLGVDSIENLKEFIDAPYENIGSKLLSYYKFDEWIKRF